LTVEYHAGDSVYTLLQRLCKKQSIELSPDLKSNSTSVYIDDIGGLYAGDNGGMSGWIYFVNGDKPDISSGNYFPKPNDTIKWVYTLDGKE
jgi:hypothetical protein